MRCLLGEIESKTGESVAICGAVISVRDHGKLAFLDIADRTGTVQCFISDKSEHFSELRKITPQSVLRLEGIVKKRPEKNVSEGKNGDLEFGIEKAEILNRAEELPFDIEQDLNLDTLFDYRPLTLRRSRDTALFSLQAKIIQAFRWHLIQNDFTEFQAPVIVGSDAEGGAEVFSVDYFDVKASLATSPQLYKQILTGVFERVFCTTKVFRAEKHSTSRHLNEYTSLDFEMGYIDDHTDVMTMVESAMRAVVGAVTGTDEMFVLNATPARLPEGNFPAMKLTEAQEFLKQETGIDCIGEPDLAPEHERALCEKSLERYGSDFVFITHYPSAKRPMYVHDDEKDPGFTKSFDLLFRGVEICSGGQRVHNYEELLKKIRNKLPQVSDPKKTFGFYLQAFKYGIPPHGGVGIGLERVTAKIAEVANTKEAAIFPRDRNRIDTRLYEQD